MGGGRGWERADNFDSGRRGRRQAIAIFVLCVQLFCPRGCILEAPLCVERGAAPVKLYH